MVKLIKQARAALSMLNPEEVRKLAVRQLEIGLVASGEAGYAEMERWLAPEELGKDARLAILQHVHRADDPHPPQQVDLVFFEAGVQAPQGQFTFYRDDPRATVLAILHEKDELSVPLARQFPAFRPYVVERIVQSVARENAMFAVATALPNVVPNLIEMPWAFGEFASDTAFLTANQIRMAFLIAAACGKEVGFAVQKAEVLTIGASAFGWRALARELAGKIPLGGGLIPKGAIAYAGTYLVGKGLEQLHHANRRYTKAEERELYLDAYERGKVVAHAFRTEPAPSRSGVN